MKNPKTDISIYTDGSCHTQQKFGAWAAIILIKDEEILLKGEEHNTTHNRMELLSVIKALEFIENKNFIDRHIIIKSDSQYVTEIKNRIRKLRSADFKTKKGNDIQNKDLVIKLIQYIENLNIDFVKVKAHQKKTNTRNFNRDADKISRQIVRKYIKNLNS